MCWKQSRLYFFLVIVLTAGLVWNNPGDEAQSADPEWSDRVVLFAAEGSGHVRDPWVVSDPSGMVHVFWTYAAELDTAIYYTHWDGHTWSSPVDILLSPGGGGTFTPAVSSDRSGVLHAIWRDAAGSLYYSQAPASRAGSAGAWSTPRYIDKGWLHPAIVADETGVLHIAYAEMDGPNLYYKRSEDGGISWSLPRSILEPVKPDAAVDTPGGPAYRPTEMGVPDPAKPETASDYIRLAVDGRGRIHVAWSVFQYPSAWPPLGVLYSRSTDGGRTWCEPLKIAGENYGLPGAATVGADTVHLVWRGTAAVGGTYHQWSTDGGQTWLAPLQFDERGGFSGAQTLVVDSMGAIHFVSADGRYSHWDGTDWSVTEWSSVSQPDFGEMAEAAISEGNRLHVVAVHDYSPQQGYRQIVYATLLLSAPAIPIRAFPTPAPTQATATPLPTRQPLATPTQAPGQHGQGSRVGPGGLSDPSIPLIAGLLPAVLVVAGIALVRILRAHGR